MLDAITTMSFEQRRELRDRAVATREKRLEAAVRGA
jgi:hypothetical protein